MDGWPDELDTILCWCIMPFWCDTQYIIAIATIMHYSVTIKHYSSKHSKVKIAILTWNMIYFFHGGGHYFEHVQLYIVLSYTHTH